MDKYKLNSTLIRQPDSGLSYDFETTYTADTTRTQNGVLHPSRMFTVESFGYKATGLTIAEMKTILQIVAKGVPYTMHYFSPYYGTWRDDTFYTGKGSLAIGYLNESTGQYDSLSFNMVGVNPI